MSGRGKEPDYAGGNVVFGNRIEQKLGWVIQSIDPFKALLNAFIIYNPFLLTVY